jgi:hypothetical protein
LALTKVQKKTRLLQELELLLISKMHKLYLIKKGIQHLEPAVKQRLRQELSIPVLNDIK